MKIAGVLFDKDGTLFDYHLSWMPANLRAALEAAGGDPELAARLMALAGYDSTSGSVRAGSPLAAWSNAEIATLWASHLPGRDGVELTALLERIFMEEGSVTSAPVTDLAALFARLRSRGLALGLATHDSEAGARAALERFGLHALLDFVTGYDSGHGTKPGPGMVQAFCTRTGLQAREIAVVGDNLHDLDMGRSAGVALLVGVLTGTSGREDLAPHADHVLDDISQLEGLLDSLS